MDYPREEIPNALSHGAGLVGAVVAGGVLVLEALQRGVAAEIVGATVFAATMVFLYLVSTLYHAWPPGRVKRFLRVLDHGAIYLLIAGTYTPFTLGVLRGTLGWILFGLVWGLAVAGIIMKLVAGLRYPVLRTGLYLAMGWLVILAADTVLTRMPPWGVFWLAAGGVAYMVGVPFYAISERVRYTHLVWHLMVMTGTTCHFFAVLWYAA